MTQLARKLRTIDYFALGFGTMVGVGWLVVMHDWLLRGGPLGCILGFAIGGAVLLPIGYVYGKLVMAMPDAGSEIAYRLTTLCCTCAPLIWNSVSSACTAIRAQTVVEMRRKSPVVAL